MSVDPLLIQQREVINATQYELAFIEQKVGELTLRKLAFALPHKAVEILNKAAGK